MSNTGFFLEMAALIIVQLMLHQLVRIYSSFVISSMGKIKEREIDEIGWYFRTRFEDQILYLVDNPRLVKASSIAVLTRSERRRWLKSPNASCDLRKRSDRVVQKNFLT